MSPTKYNRERNYIISSLRHAMCIMEVSSFDTVKKINFITTPF